jgi:hypothetical protein
VAGLDFRISVIENYLIFVFFWVFAVSAFNGFPTKQVPFGKKALFSKSTFLVMWLLKEPGHYP